MKTNGILNSDVSRILSYMRHTDSICIGDCGLACPDSVELIDLSVSKNLPSFLQVLDAILADYKAEKFFLATEIKENNSDLLKDIDERLSNIPCTFISHEELKQNLSNCKAVIRTGEMTPYANIILQSGCIF
ncbi:MAG: D-ribose pyranase [Spirochaetaceae bacterium]|nr:D-ribose pyranase [Spirochaetaceae bacterium]